jgi:DNA-directed RNA polymerase specialized sigma24 family protein
METVCALQTRRAQVPVAMFESLYEQAFPAVARFVSARKGALDDAFDIFHDALVIFYEKTETGFVPAISPEAYLLGIAKHLWLHRFAHERRSVSLDDAEKTITLPEDYFPKVNDVRLLRFLESAGKRCLDLLHAFYYEKQSLDTIAKAFGFSTVRSATVQKFKCIEKVRHTIQEKSLQYEDFLE